MPYPGTKPPKTKVDDAVVWDAALRYLADRLEQNGGKVEYVSVNPADIAGWSYSSYSGGWSKLGTTRPEFHLEDLTTNQVKGSLRRAVLAGKLVERKARGGTLAFITPEMAEHLDRKAADQVAATEALTARWTEARARAERFGLTIEYDQFRKRFGDQGFTVPIDTVEALLDIADLYETLREEGGNP